VSSDHLGVDDLLADRVAERLGDRTVATDAILVVHAMTERGHELRFFTSDGTTAMTLLGMVRSITLKLEADDLGSWEPED
jgi:hypothetical protein